MLKLPVKSYKEQLEEMKNSGRGLAWQRGLTLFNSNGAIDSNTMGYEYTTQTTTLIRARVREQKFYEIPFAEYIPVIVGEGAYLENIKTNIEYQSAGDFESGLQSTSEDARIATVSVGIAPITTVINTWVKGYQYSDMEVEKALAADNWNPIEAKMRALKKNWDLGVQKIAFLGSYRDPTGTPGLLSNGQVTVNTAVIPTNISSMSYTQFGTFVATVMNAYFQNSNDTVMPNTFEIPMSDYLGLITPINPQFPNVSMLTYLEDAFRRVTQNPNFRIYPCAYGDAARNAGVWTSNGTYRYCLYRNDEETMTMDIPLPFVLRGPMSPNNFNWNGVAQGQYSGLIIFRVPEVIYFDHT
jgi:hypothetical protein